jgi:hypothetical protein
MGRITPRPEAPNLASFDGEKLSRYHSRPSPDFTSSQLVSRSMLVQTYRIGRSC